MNTADLIAVVRRQALIEPSNIDFTDSVIIQELNHAITLKFERAILDARANYWIQYQDYTLTVGQPYYRLPRRALNISKIEIGGPDAAASTGFIRLPETAENRIDVFQSAPATLDQPVRYVIRGDRVFLDPAPNQGYTMRIWFYMRPSRLVPSQAANAGFITGVTGSGGATPQVTLSAPIVYYNDAGASTTTTAGGINFNCDIIPGSGSLTTPSTGSAGWRDLLVYDRDATFAVGGTTITFASGTDLSLVRVGDYLRSSEQTDWPQIPEDFHRAVADIAAVSVLTQRDFHGKAGAIASGVSSDLERFIGVIADRVQEEAIPHRAELPSLRPGRYYGGGGWR